jgi:microcompartment protein CcmL/EutN
MLEVASIAAGIETTDALSKEADIRLVTARSVSPGKFLILLAGPVEEVSSAMRRGTEVGHPFLIDRLFIPNLEPTLYDLILDADEGTGEAANAAAVPLDAVGLIETLSVASTIRAADIASKTASLTLLRLALARGIGGKSWVAFTGEVSDVEAAVAAGAADAEAAGLLVARVVIPSPHGNLREVLGA